MEAQVEVPQGAAGPAAGAVATAHTTALTMGNVDTVNSAKMAFDLPTETLSGMGSVIEGDTFTVRSGNRVFSKPPYKASMSLDGQGLMAAGTEVMDGSALFVDKRILPNEIQVGQLHCVLNPEGAATSSRSYSQNVGDVGATYSIQVEATNASFRANYQGYNAATTDADRDVVDNS